MARSTRSFTSTNPVGVPRTHGAAQKLGYKPAGVRFADLPAEAKANFMQLSQTGARPGSLCGIGPSNDDRYWLVCYKHDGKTCTWVQVPRGAPIPDHD
jgi:hypothetical protein